MIVNLLTEYHLVFLSLTGGCRGSSESTLVKIAENLMPWLIYRRMAPFIASEYGMQSLIKLFFCGRVLWL